MFVCTFQFSILILLGVKLIVDVLNDIKDNNNVTNSSGAEDKSATETIFEVRLFLKVFIGEDIKIFIYVNRYMRLTIICVCCCCCGFVSSEIVQSGL